MDVQPLEPAVVALLDGFARSPSSLEPYLNFARGRYTRNVLYRDASVELLALCWDRDCRSTIHDHASQECMFRVVAGTFRIEDFRLVATGPEGFARVELIAREDGLAAGDVDLRGLDNPIHRVSVMPGSGPAVSLHVYRHPIRECRVFDPVRNRSALMRLRDDSDAREILRRRSGASTLVVR